MSDSIIAAYGAAPLPSDYGDLTTPAPAPLPALELTSEPPSLGDVLRRMFRLNPMLKSASVEAVRLPDGRLSIEIRTEE